VCSVHSTGLHCWRRCRPEDCNGEEEGPKQDCQGRRWEAAGKRAQGAVCVCVLLLSLEGYGQAPVLYSMMWNQGPNRVAKEVGDNQLEIWRQSARFWSVMLNLNSWCALSRRRKAQTGLPTRLATSSWKCEGNLQRNGVWCLILKWMRSFMWKKGLNRVANEVGDKQLEMWRQAAT